MLARSDLPASSDALVVRLTKSVHAVTGTARVRETEDGSDVVATIPSATGNVVGTPRYMSPEQHAGGTADARSDQFSFCASLYYAVFGQAPFAGDTVDELRATVMAGRLRAPPPERARRVPGWLLRAVRRGLATSQEERWPSMAALVEHLGADRGKPWRRAGVATAVGLAAVALVTSWRAAHEPLCRDAGRPLDGVWDTAVQEAARRSFLASGRLDAAATFDRVARALDGYTRDWVAMSTETCEATAVRHVQSDALLDRRVACLERRRGALRELTLLLRAPLTAASVDHAVAAASHLDNLAPCADTAALMATVPPSHEPRIAAVEKRAVAEARGTGATAIKLYAELSGALARRITTEAHAQGLKVWAHAALDQARPIDVVEAGVDAISHASLVSLAMDSARRAAALHAPANEPMDLHDAGLDTLFTTMVRRHTVFEPTLLIFADSPPVLRLAGAIARMAHERGVTIIAGTDTLGTADADSLTLPNLHRELELLVTLAGLSPAEALESATRDAAAVLSAQSIRGTIEVGKLADMVVLRSDPLLDIRNTRSIQLVMKRGRVVR